MTAEIEAPTVPAVAAECILCGHVWIVAYLPMEMSLMGKVAKNVRCPVCAEPKPMVAKSAAVAEVLKRNPPPKGWPRG